jgi:hypothetical protein
VGWTNNEYRHIANASTLCLTQTGHFKMSMDLGELKELKSENPLRRVYDSFGAGVGYISVISGNGNEGIGSCFHIGDGVFITAKHVVENCKIKEIGTTVHQRQYFEIEETKTTGMVRANLTFTPQKTSNFIGPFLNPNPKIDVAAILVPDLKAPVLLLGDHLDDSLGQEYILSEVVVMGYPRIPYSREPLLIVSKCEVNAIVDKYTGGHPHFILSSMARGGFSGGPAITEEGIVLGVVTESLIANDQPTELGYLSVMSVEGIYNCISHHRIVPKHIDRMWDGFWNRESIMYSSSPADHVDISIYRGENQYYFEVFSYRKDIIENAIKIVEREKGKDISIEWRHDKMIKIDFKEKSINEEEANNLYSMLNEMVNQLGIKRFGTNHSDKLESSTPDQINLE